MRASILMLVCILLAIPAQARIIYVDVDADGANDGSNWRDAYNYLQDALTHARTHPYVTEIRVSKGIYKPDRGVGTAPGERTATFQLINAVALRGGYAGSGVSDPNDRKIQGYETILSGDLDGNDVEVADACDLLREPTRYENSFHVVSGDATDQTAVLDGFTIIGGNANGSDANHNGGGMANYGGSPTLANCTFTKNSASGDGGGMAHYRSSPTLTNCIVSGNSANADGGGIRCDEGNPTIAHCVIKGNWASDGGGGIYSTRGSPTISRCTVMGNSAHMGAGMSCGEDCSLSMKNCIISGNMSNEVGGAMDCWKCSPSITGCTISGNTTGGNGGGLFFSHASPTITNCAIIGNMVTGYTFGDVSISLGGGVFCSHPCTAFVTNCTIVGNSAYGAEDFNAGGGIFSFDDSNLTVNNCILWGNSAAEGAQIALSLIIDSNDYGSSTMTVSYSDVQDEVLGVYVESAGTLNWGDGNIDADPLFLDANGPDGTIGTQDDDLRLSSGSPCMDAGDNNSVPLDTADLDNDGNTIELLPYDINGHRRLIDGDCNDTEVVDMGAYESNYAYMGDFDYDCDVDFEDFGIFGSAWMSEARDEDWDRHCDISMPPDEYIDWRDLKLLCDNWLADIP